MKLTAKLIGGIASVTLVLLCLASPAYSRANTAETAQESNGSVAQFPDTTHIIPLIGNLSDRLAKVRLDLANQLDLSSIIATQALMSQKINGAEQLFDQAEKAGKLKWLTARELRGDLSEAHSRLAEQTDNLNKEIQRYADWKVEWQVEKQKWRRWQENLTDQEPGQVLKAFQLAEETIDTALKLIIDQLDSLLELQAKSTEIEQRVTLLKLRATPDVMSARLQDLRVTLPSMLSPSYKAHFNRNMLLTALQNSSSISLPGIRYLKDHVWTFVSQLLLTALIVSVIVIKRNELMSSKHWGVLVKRPVSVGLLIGILLTLSVPTSGTTSPFVLTLFAIISGISFIRIMNQMVSKSWQKGFVSWIVILFMLNSILSTINLPFPLYRLYVLLASLLFMLACLRWSKRGIKTDEKAVRNRFVLLGNGGFFALIAFYQLTGKAGWATYLYTSAINSLTIIFAFIFLTHIMQGLLVWFFNYSPIWNIKLLRSEASRLVSWFNTLFKIAVVVVLVPLNLKIWGVYDTQAEAFSQFLSLGVTFGSVRIDIQLAMTIFAILYTTLLFSWVIPRVCLDELFLGKTIERGARIAISSLVKYLVIFCGVLVLFSTLGLDLTKLTIILSALGVGIGLGLQGIVNDFFSGLILLFEQPIRVGDTIELDGYWCEIKDIGLRSVNVTTQEQATIIVPNSDLIKNHITNWTLGQHQIRISVQIGVAYGSDVSLVMTTLVESGKQHELVSNKPAPEVIFYEFGESTLDFELRIWTMNANKRFRIASDLRKEINQRFQEADIEIAFPQRDIHIRNPQGDRVQVIGTDGTGVDYGNPEKQVVTSEN